MVRNFGNSALSLRRLALALQLLLLPVLALCLAPPLPAAAARAPQDDTPPGAKLLARIPVAPLGYEAPGALYLLSGFAFNSLDFIDSDHLLFTFHAAGLLRRERDATASDDDQMIHADVLAVPDGRVQAAADWRMHDHARYLWALSGGRFLVRQRDAYWTTDASLKLQALIRSPTPILTTEVSPDGRLMLIEDVYERHTPEEHKKLSLEDDDNPPAEDAIIAMLDVATKDIQAEFHVQEPMALPVTSSGYLEGEEKKAGDYVITYHPFHGEPVPLGSVASVCDPRATFISTTAVMIASCGPNTPDLYLDAWTIDGKKLWQGRRDGTLALPNVVPALDGNRFAIALLHLSHPATTPESITDGDVESQQVQVFDTKSGALLLATDASPILAAGQNFALSADGTRLAVLRNGVIDVYEIPSTPLEQKKKK